MGTDRHAAIVADPAFGRELLQPHPSPNPNPNPNPNPSPNPKPKPKPKPKPNPNSNPDQERDNPGSAKPKADAFSGSLDSASTACILSGKSSQTLVEGAADGVVAGEPPKKGGRSGKGVFEESGAGSR